MNILFLHTFNLGKGWGGSASMLCALHRAFTGMGHGVRVVSARRPDPFGFTSCELPLDRTLTFGPEKRPGETAIAELSSDEILAIALAAADKIEREEFPLVRPDLMIANHINLMALICWHLFRRSGIPYRLISYGTDTRLLLAEQRFRDLFGAAAQAAEGIFTISGYVAKEVEATVGGRVAVLGGAVDPALFYPVDPPQAHPRRLVYVGRLVSEKGIMTLLDALDRQSGADELVIVGEGPQRPAIEARLARRPGRCRVVLAGHHSQESLRQVYATAGAVVVPSTWQEPLGLVVLEALACGVPVIASRVGGIPEMIEHGKTGLLVPEGDPAALAGAIDHLLADPAVYRTIRGAIAAARVPVHNDLAVRLLATP